MAGAFPHNRVNIVQTIKLVLVFIDSFQDKSSLPFRNRKRNSPALHSCFGKGLISSPIDLAGQKALTVRKSYNRNGKQAADDQRQSGQKPDLFLMLG
jgi:hypothetical protein